MNRLLGRENELPFPHPNTTPTMNPNSFIANAYWGAAAMGASWAANALGFLLVLLLSAESPQDGLGLLGMTFVFAALAFLFAVLPFARLLDRLCVALGADWKFALLMYLYAATVLDLMLFGFMGGATSLKELALGFAAWLVQWGGLHGLLWAVLYAGLRRRYLRGLGA